MNRIALAITLATLSLIASHAAAPEPARCAWCPGFTCYSTSQCGGNGCVCMQSGRSPRGQCIGIMPNER